MQLHALSQLSSVIADLLFWSNFCLAFDSSKSITNLHYHAQEALRSVFFSWRDPNFEKKTPLNAAYLNNHQDS